VREALGLRSTARITESVLLELTSLAAPGRGISDLRGLEHAKRLDSLYLPDNRIVDVSPLKGLLRLHELTLRNNRISDIFALAGLVNLDDSVHLG